MKLQRICMLVFLFCSWLVPGQVVSYNLNPERDIYALHKNLTKDLDTDLEKVKSFYDWIALNIRYDVAEARQVNRSSKKQEAASVLRSGKAVCHGYATLFTELCNLSGIPSFLISGYTRQDQFSNEGHAWNVVFVEGKWHHVDVTWGSGEVNQKGKYVAKYTDSYFLPDPLDFLTEHYPFDPMWQLITYPVRLNAYRKAEWKYADKTTPYFNFNDTIAQWLLNDSTDRLYVSALRMNRFNPGDERMKEELSFALFKKGNAEFDKGNTLIATMESGAKRSAYSRREMGHVAGKLDLIESYFRQAESYYMKVEPGDPSEKYALQGNLDAVRHNLELVRKVKQKLGRN
jgi:hypothetical protein